MGGEGRGGEGRGGEGRGGEGHGSEVIKYLESSSRAEAGGTLNLVAATKNRAFLLM